MDFDVDCEMGVVAKKAIGILGQDGLGIVEETPQPIWFCGLDGEELE